MFSVCLPSDALLQHLPSYLGFSYLGHGVSLHGCSSKSQPLLLTLEEGYLLTTTLPDLQRGIAALGPPAPAQPPLVGLFLPVLPLASDIVKGYCQRLMLANCQHLLDHQNSKRVPEKHLLLLYWLFVFQELSCFFDDPTNVDNLIAGFSAFSKSSLNIWKFLGWSPSYCWSLAWRILSITLLACEMSAIVQ